MKTSDTIPTVDEIIGWDVLAWSRAFEMWRRNSDVPLRGSRVLEIGAGPGGLSLFFASEGASVVCSDLNDPVQARDNHSGRRLPGTIEYRALDLTKWPADIGQFDVVCTKSVIGALGLHPPVPYPDVFKRIIGSLKAGGEYWFAENLSATIVHRLARRLVPWGRTWKYFDVGELRSAMPGAVDVHIETYGLIGAFGRTERQRRLLSQVEDALRLEHLLPERWRYLAAGIARRAR